MKTPTETTTLLLAKHLHTQQSPKLNIQDFWQRHNLKHHYSRKRQVLEAFQNKGLLKSHPSNFNQIELTELGVKLLLENSQTLPFNTLPSILPPQYPNNKPPITQTIYEPTIFATWNAVKGLHPIIKIITVVILFYILVFPIYFFFFYHPDNVFAVSLSITIGGFTLGIFTNALLKK